MNCTRFKRRLAEKMPGNGGESPSYLARSLTLPNFQVAEDFFAILVATASSSICWTSGVELLATGSYVGTVSGDLPHLTQDVSVHRHV